MGEGELAKLATASAEDTPEASDGATVARGSDRLRRGEVRPTSKMASDTLANLLTDPRTESDAQVLELAPEDRKTQRMRARQFQALLEAGNASAVPLAADFLRSIQSRAPTLDDPDTIRRLVEQMASEPDDAPPTAGSPADMQRPTLTTSELTPDMIVDVSTPRAAPPRTVPLDPEQLAQLAKPAAKQAALVVADYRFDTRRAALPPITKPPETKPLAAPRTTQNMEPLTGGTPPRHDIGLLIVVGAFVLVLAGVVAIVVR